ncbi:hypothetical protein M405DRAFT_846652 [Rhizopogon salebrosus TDB-379]|nr:hypothetical protein M405DRAFT_846652 [Rhizopogon salebrosus TDB-379]
MQSPTGSAAFERKTAVSVNGMLSILLSEADQAFSRATLGRDERTDSGPRQRRSRECKLWFAHGELRTDGARRDCARARGEGLEGVVAVLWLGRRVVGHGGGEGATPYFEGWGVLPFPKTDAELDAGIEATLEVRIRTDTEGVFLCLEGLRDVKLMTGEAGCFCEGVATDVSDMRGAPGRG